MTNRTWFGIAALLPVLFTAGCSGGAPKNAASINGEAISEADFLQRLQSATTTEMAAAVQQGELGKVGDYIMSTLIGEKILQQLAKEKGVTPTDDQVKAFIPFAKKFQNPAVTYMKPNPARTEEEWKHDAQIALCIRNLSMAQIKITPDELQKKYDALKDRQLTPEDQYHLRIIDCTTLANATEALEALKNVAFETVALTKSEDPESRKRNGDVGFVPQTRVPPALLVAVRDLKPNKITGIVKLDTPSGPDAGAKPAASHYMIAQLVEKKAGVASKLDEVKPLVERYILQEKDRGALERVQEDIRKFREKAKIEITQKGYEKLLDKMLTNKPTANGQQAPSGGPQPRAGQPGPQPGAPAPGQ